MWDDLLSRIANFCKNLLLLGERLDRQTTEIKEIREEIKLLSHTAVDLRLEVGRLQSEMKLIDERQEHEIKHANDRFETFTMKGGLLLQRVEQESRQAANRLDRPEPHGLNE